jgi:hypothetical protein
MPLTLHSVTELRNRFFYDADTGEFRWRKVDFSVWAKGKPRPSQPRYHNWLRQFAGQPVRPTYINGVPFIRYRERPYAIGRLLWALKNGKHPADHLFVVFRNGDSADLRGENLHLVDRGGLRRARAARARGEIASPRAYLPRVDIVQAWLRYEDGDLFYQAVSFPEFLRRYPTATPDKHSRWLRDNAGKALPTVRRRKAPQRVLYGTRRLSKPDLIFAACRGFYPPDGVELQHVDGDWCNCRIENLRLSTPETEGEG